MLPIINRPITPNINIVNQSPLKHSNVDILSSAKEKETHLKNVFTTYCLKSIDVVPTNANQQIDIVWNELSEKYNESMVFDFHYLFRIYKEYIEFCEHVDIIPYGSIILAILFQNSSISKQNTGSVEKSAEYAYECLRNKFFCAVSVCCKVKRLILSLKSLKSKDEQSENQYRDLNLARLGYEWYEFTKHQSNIDINRIRLVLSRLELLQCKLAINQELLKMGEDIYSVTYFKSKYTKKAKDNLIQYNKALLGDIVRLESSINNKVS